jgi:uncharacterized protein with GYD domain
LEKYLVLIKLRLTKATAFWEPFDKLKAAPMKGVKLTASYSVFGKWDIAIWFEAESNDMALHFVGDRLRGIEGILETRTIPMTLYEEYGKK